MKSKGAVKFFAIALALVCLFQLSFTFIAGQWDRKADRYANGDPVKKKHFVDSAGGKPIYNILVRKYNYQDVKERTLNLGLDLRGGMHVTLEVEMNELLKKLSNNDPNKDFNQALSEAKIEQRNSRKSFIDLFYEHLKKINPNAKLAPIFAISENKSAGINPGVSDDVVLKFLREQAASALDRTYNIIGTRIDKFGVTQPNKQKDDVAGRIIVELPGTDDSVRVRKYLQGSAHLEFYLTYTLGEIYKNLMDADKALYDHMQQGNKGADTLLHANKDKTDTTAKAKSEASVIPLAGEKKDTSKGKGIKDTLKKGSTVKKDVKKPEQRDNPLIKALFPGGFPTQQAAQAYSVMPIAARVLASDTAKVNRMLEKEEVKNALPPDIKFAWNSKTEEDEQNRTQYIDLVPLKKNNYGTGVESALGGDVVTDAFKDFDQQSNAYEVSMQMNPTGAKAWAQITRENVGKHIAIVLDDMVYSAPRVNGEIPGGRSQITGNFTAKEAGDLANILKAGKLPVRVQIIEEAFVGPSMGQDAIQKGFLSLLAGLVAIVIFMIAYYNRSGWVANIALLVNLFFIIGVLASLGAALTLPGIAGIVLTLATAVDANVLIYERIKDELLEGKGIKLAIAEGFKNALSSIIDANFVTLLIGGILMKFGQGPIFGFAVVLVIGILTSLFTSILITRLMFDWLLEKESKIEFNTKNSGGLLRNINYDFVGKRKIFYMISGVIIGIGIISLATRGLNYGVDFQGGNSYKIGFHKAPNISDVRSKLTAAFEGKTPEVKTFGNDTMLNITTDYKSTDTSTTVVKNALIKGLASLGPDYKPRFYGEQRVGATIASDIRNSAWYSVLFSLLFIFIYIIIRFKHWQFALGATVALAHDLFFVLTIFSLFKDIMPFSLDVDQSIVAALLTVCVYSMNDTVVVFDRIREYLNNNKKSAMIPTINDAINKTLSRTVITSFTIFLVVAILFIFGGQVIKGFAFAMLVGVIIGTYSSIFVATPIVVDFQKKKELDSTLA